MLETEILIVGGGASGLTSSLLLSSTGTQSLLVSKYPHTSTIPKAHLLSIKTMEIMRELGLEPEIRAMSTPPQNMRYAGWFAGVAGPTPDHGREIARMAAWGFGHQDAEHAMLEDLWGRTALGDLLGQGRFVLIAADDGELWREAATRIACERGIALDVIVIGSHDGDRLDMRHQWERVRAFGPTGAILVRPDRFIAWRAMSAPEQPYAALDGAFARVLGTYSPFVPATASRKVEDLVA